MFVLENYSLLIITLESVDTKVKLNRTTRQRTPGKGQLRRAHFTTTFSFFSLRCLRQVFA